MLEMKKNVTLTGSSVIDGVVAEGFSAVIDSDNPEDISITSWQNEKKVYKANRTICRADEAAFEEAAYEIQDQMIAEKEAEMEE